MTLEELQNLPGEILTPSQVAPLIGMDPNTLRAQAHEDPRKLGFGVIVTGSRVKIPKRAFIRFMLGEK